MSAPMPTVAVKHTPTSIRLTPETRASLAQVARQRRQSQSGIAEIAIKRYIASLTETRSEPTVEEKLKYLRELADADPIGGGRSMEAIDADIRDMRRDRF